MALTGCNETAEWQRRCFCILLKVIFLALVEVVFLVTTIAHVEISSGRQPV